MKKKTLKFLLDGMERTPRNIGFVIIVDSVFLAFLFPNATGLIENILTTLLVIRVYHQDVVFGKSDVIDFLNGFDIGILLNCVSNFYCNI